MTYETPRSENRTEGRGQHLTDEQDRDRRGAAVKWGAAALAITSAAAGVLVYQNTASAPLWIFWWRFDIPMVVIIGITAAITLLIEKLVRMILERRKRRPRAQQAPPPGQTAPPNT